MDVLDSPVHGLMGVHTARRTVQNVEEAGGALDEVSSLSWGDVYRRIIAHKPPDGSSPGRPSLYNLLTFRQIDP